MADDKGKGAAPAPGLGGLGFLIVLMVVFSLWLTSNGPNSVNNKLKANTQTKKQTTSSASSKTTSSSNHTTSSVEDKTEDGKSYSPYHEYISLKATSVSPDSANKEYVTLSASKNKEPINIGGWTLKNGREKKTYLISGNPVKGQSISVKIPDQGVALYNPFNPSSNILGPITLKSGEKALIFTGSVPTIGSAQIKDNFKINRCLGYVEDRPLDQRSGTYVFRPSLKYKCPTSKDLPSIDDLDETCYKFARSVAGCHTPTEIYVKNNGYCMDRNCKLASYCQSFIKQNFNPQTCYKLYSKDDDFIGPEWRVYLNRTWELWDKQRETISLYDRSGLLVDEVSY